MRCIALLLIAVVASVSATYAGDGLRTIEIPKSVSVHPVTASVTLPYSALLPGVPFDLVVTMHNVSTQPVCVGTSAVLVANADGTPVLTGNEFANGAEFSKPSDEPTIEIAAGKTVEREIGPHRWTSSWQSLTQLSAPGSYEISLIIDRASDDQDASTILLAGPIRTSSTRLTRLLPEGEDAALWQRMQQLGKGHWPADGFRSVPGGKELANEILAQHPTSAYYPYALLLAGGDFRAVHIPMLVDVAERFEESPARPHLLFAAAATAVGEADTVLKAGNWASAGPLYAAAEQHALAARRAGFAASGQLERLLWRARAGRDRVRTHLAVPRKSAAVE